MSAGTASSAIGARRRSRRPTVGDNVPDAFAHAIREEDGRAAALKRLLARLALDIHDGPLQNLTLIGLDLDAFGGRIRSLVPPEAHAKVDAGVDQLIEELGRVERDLRALLAALEQGSCETVSIVEAIESEIAEFECKSSARVELTVDGFVQPGSDSQGHALQAIVHEALNNVAKHADAETVAVRLAGTAAGIALEIEDDGRGFDADEPRMCDRFGLAGMRKRAELLGGRTEIRSRPGGHTVVTTTLRNWSRSAGPSQRPLDIPNE